jgi:hypothetical protein
MPTNPNIFKDSIKADAYKVTVYCAFEPVSANSLAPPHMIVRKENQ